MLSFQEVLPTGVKTAGPDRRSAGDRRAAEALRRALGIDFHLFDGASGDRLYASPEQPGCPRTAWGPLCVEVARRGQPEFLEEEPPFLVLALPLPETDGRATVAVSVFVTRPVDPVEDLSQPASMLETDPQEAACWAAQQPLWTPDSLERMGRLVLDNLAKTSRIEQLEQETHDLSLNLVGTYEEISLLYRLTQNLKISRSDEDLGRIALEWMREVVPARALAIQFLPVDDAEESLTQRGRTKSLLIARGECPLDDAAFSRLIERLGPTVRTGLKVLNGATTRDPAWPFPDVRQLICVPLAEGDNLFGWLAAFNHVDNREFGTVEASLLSSVAAILGIHSGNIELYRQQSELLAGIVRALTSAIDAKDPYTCGHSDRVARAAVLLAQELGCDASSLETMYLSGLLHDIGKIGIDDSVLRKPDKLTDEEYEQIKRHVRIGHRILQDLRKLDDVVPVVLYHHESWDGNGYPLHLTEQDIPRSARIVAVADAFDAMGSDRPYRKGMPDEKIDAIFRAGAGKQWDPEVVDAFFRVRDQIRDIMRSEHQAG